MKSSIKVIALLAVLWSSMGAGASVQLAQKYACAACHQADAKGVGPSWTSIRDKYKDGSVTPAQLAKIVKTGSSGKWGSIPMPAQGAVPDADAEALAGWILKGK